MIGGYNTDSASLNFWFNQNEGIIISYIETHYFLQESREHQYRLMYKYKYFSMVLIENYVLSNEQKINILLKNLSWGDGEEGKLITVTAGKRGGKTAFCFFLLEEYHKRKPNLKFAFITKRDILPPLPDWISVVNSIEDLKPFTVAVADEGAVDFNARKSMYHDQIDDMETLPILSHKKITLIVNTQHDDLIDLNIHRTSDMKVLKHGGKIPKKKFIEEVSEEKEMIRNRLKARSVKEAYVEIQRDVETGRERILHFSHGLPTFWSQKLSKSFETAKVGKSYRKDKEEREEQNNQEQLKVSIEKKRAYDW